VTVHVDRRTFLVSAGSSTLALAAAGRPRRRSVARAPARTLAQAIRGRVIERGAPGFAEAAHVFNERFDGIRPRAVAFPVDARDVRDAVRWTVAHGVPVRARSGGHSYEGYSTFSEGVVLDLRRLRAIGVNRRARTATVGAGAQLIDVYAGLARHQVTIPAGTCPSVGIGGHALGGGMGLAGRRFGLTTDNLLAAEIVTADGALRRVDQRGDPDLLWALRGGGGGNFGIVTSFDLRLHEMPRSAAYFLVHWPWSSADHALDAWLRWAPHARDSLTSIMHLEAAGGATTVSVSGQYFGSASDLGGLLAPLTAVPGASLTTGDQDYLGLQLRWAGCSGIGLDACHTAGTRSGGTLPRESFRAKSDYLVKRLSAAGRRRLIGAVEARAGISGPGAILLDSYGGAINRRAPDASAFVHRNALACIQYLTYDGGSAWIGETHAAMRPHVSGMAYQNYIDRDLRDWRHAYYGANYRRLEATRRRVDPGHYFNFPQAIGR